MRKQLPRTYRTCPWLSIAMASRVGHAGAETTRREGNRSLPNVSRSLRIQGLNPHHPRMVSAGSPIET